MLKKLHGNLLYKLAVSHASRKSLSKAHRYYHKSAKLGNVLSQYKLGLNYFSGVGCLRSGTEALYWFEQAAAAGHIDAQFELGMALLNDRDAFWCIGSAANWAIRQADQKQNTSDIAIFPNGFILVKDEGKAFEWIKLAATGGKPEAQANLGWLYIKGIGCSVDPIAARDWLEKASSLHIPSAAFGLAELYGGLAGHPRDEIEALRWLNRAADLKHASALYNLGRFHSVRHTDQSRQAAIRYLTLASDRRHVAASLDLAKLLLTSGKKSDIEVAEEKLRLSVKLGSVEAALLLGRLYCKFDYAGADYKQAFSWFKVAADQENANGQFELACMYAQGRGIAKIYRVRLITFLKPLVRAWNSGV